MVYLGKHADPAALVIPRDAALGDAQGEDWIAQYYRRLQAGIVDFPVDDATVVMPRLDEAAAQAPSASPARPGRNQHTGTAAGPGGGAVRRVPGVGTERSHLPGT